MSGADVTLTRATDAWCVAANVALLGWPTLDRGRIAAGCRAAIAAAQIPGIPCSERMPSEDMVESLRYLRAALNWMRREHWHLERLCYPADHAKVLLEKAERALADITTKLTNQDDPNHGRQ